MNTILRKLQDANRKAAKLERLILRLKEEKLGLQAQLKALKTEIADKEEAFDSMVEKYEAVKLVKHLNNHEDRAFMQEKIDLYLKEIDTCLKNFGE